MLRRGRVSLEDESGTQKKLALELSNQLGNLPLALDQAGAFIEETPSSISEYLELYRQRKSKLLQRRGHQTDDHPSVEVTFALAFTKIEEANKTAGELLRLAAFCASEDILEEIFIQHFFSHENYQEGFDRLKFAEALREAGKFSLIRRDPLRQSVDMHRLIQVIIRDTMKSEDQERWVAHSLEALNGAVYNFKFAAESILYNTESEMSQLDAWLATERLLPHIQCCTQLAESWTIKSPVILRKFISLLDNAGRYMVERGRLIDAESLHQKSLALLEQQGDLRINGLELVSKLNELALVYFGRRKYVQAESLFRRALEIIKKYENDRDIAVALNNLGLVLYKQGKHAAADPF